MEKTMLDRAISNNRMVSDILKGNPTDEYYLSNCCFLMQQAIEYAVKFILDKLNIDYRRTHNIAVLIDNIESEYPFFLTELKEKSDEITDWETTSRYVLNFRSTKREIQDIQRLFGLLLNEIEYNINYIGSPEYNYCYNELKKKGYQYRPDISRCLVDIAKDIKPPYAENIYSIIKENLDSYFNVSADNDISLEPLKFGR